MKGKVLLVALALISLNSFSQDSCTFEEFGLSAESSNNNPGESGVFVSGNTILPNSYNADFNSFTGWALSTMTDVTTPGFGNQFSAITGGGQNSVTYGVAYTTGNMLLKFDQTSNLGTMAITNSTYAYLSMQDGDAFAKKFGGLSGDDPDFFRLTIKNYFEGVISSDEIVVDLADFTFADNSQDYILSEWLEVDLSSFGLSDSLEFSLSSTDNGDFGMNTPAYFCVDNIESFPAIISVEEQAELLSNAYPNPFQELVTFDLREEKNIVFHNVSGQKIAEFMLEAGTHRIDLSDLKQGVYLVSFHGKSGVMTERLLKSY